MKIYKDGKEILIDRRSPEGKDFYLNDFKSKNIKAWEDLLNKTKDPNEKERIQKFIDYEKQGGICHKCGKPWNEIKKENKFYLLKYWIPGCFCYMKCPVCGRSNHYEFERKGRDATQFYCKCGFRILKDHSVFYGLKYEKANVDFLNRLREKKGLRYLEFNGEMKYKRGFE